MNNLETLERIAEAVRLCHANMAPTYNEYYTLALGIASSCGEAGRTFFHEFCSVSPKYSRTDADKFYSYCLHHADGRIGMGTVIHLARQAGCILEPTGAEAQKPSLSFPSPLPHTHTRYSNVYPQNHPDLPPETEDLEGDFPDDEGFGAHLPTFPDHPFPPFIQQMLDLAPSTPQRDAMLLGITTVLGVTLNWFTFTYYGSRKTYPNLLHMTLGSPASGKGAVSWIKQLAVPVHEAYMDLYQCEMKQYRRERQAWECLGNKRKDVDIPQEPAQRLFIIPGNNSSTGIKDNLIAAGGVGLVFETEIDTMGSAISADYGHFGDTLRKGYDNDEISYFRRTEHEYRQTHRSCFGVCLTGTMSQLYGIIPNAEDGLQSRFLFYVLPEISGWINQFEHQKSDYNQQFHTWGVQWKKTLDAVRGVASSFELELTDDQVERFNAHFSRIFGRACAVHGGPMKSAVARLGLNLCRMMSVIATVRALESLLPVNGQQTDDVLPDTPQAVLKKLLASPYLQPAGHIPHENLQDGTYSTFTMRISDEDFQGLLDLVEPLYLHSGFVFSLLPKAQRPKPATNPRQVFDCLPLIFTREQIIEAGKQFNLSEKGVDSLLRRNLLNHTLEKTGRGLYRFCKKVRNPEDDPEKKKKEAKKKKKKAEPEDPQK